MPEVLTSRTDKICQLDGETTNRVLRTAIEERAAVQVRADCAGWELAGCAACISEDGSHLILELENADPQTQAILESSPLQLSMEVAGAQYCFETRFADQTAEVEPGVVRVLKPATITLAERRRSLRRRLRKPTEVALQASGPDDRWHCTAAMLNLSLEGIACRICAQNAELVDIGQTLRVGFQLDASAPALDLNGRIISITQGGTPDHLVVGLVFIVDRRLEASRATLRKALETTY